MSAVDMTIKARCAELELSFDQAQRIAFASGADLPSVLGLNSVTLAPLKPRRWLWMAAQTSGVSYRGSLPPEVLLRILTTGDVPSEFVAHVVHLLEEAPIQIVVLAIEQAAEQSGVPIARIWRNVARLGDEWESRRIKTSVFGDPNLIASTRPRTV